MAPSVNVPFITLLVRPNCHLCDEARATLKRVAQTAVVAWEERDVDADPELAYEYGDRIPVILLNGTEHSYWRVDEQRLTADVARITSQLRS